jgi:hypothetical protein
MGAFEPFCGTYLQLVADKMLRAPKADTPQLHPAQSISLIDSGGGAFRQGVRWVERSFANRKSSCVVQSRIRKSRRQT